MTARDIHGFLTLSSWLQINENTIEIAFNLKENFMQRRKGAKAQRRKVPDRLWIIKITYLTGRTNKLQRILPESDILHIRINF